jgi:hypothetical protein
MYGNRLYPMVPTTKIIHNTMNTNNDRNLLIKKLVRLVELLKVYPAARTLQQREEIALVSQDVEDLKVKIGKQPTTNQFTGYVAKPVTA